MDEAALHPLVKIAAIVEQYGGEGMEIRERPFNRGALLRIWMPSARSTTMIGLVCANVGIREYEVMDHVDTTRGRPGARGVQMTITIPPSLVRSYQDMMSRINMPQLHTSEEPLALGPAPDDA